MSPNNLVCKLIFSWYVVNIHYNPPTSFPFTVLQCQQITKRFSFHLTEGSFVEMRVLIWTSRWLSKHYLNKILTNNARLSENNIFGFLIILIQIVQKNSCFWMAVSLSLCIAYITAIKIVSLCLYIRNNASVNCVDFNLR